MRKREFPLSIVMGTLVLLASAGAALSTPTYDLDLFTGNGLFANDPAVDIFVYVTPLPGQVRFEFHNDSTVDSVLANIYFDAEHLFSDVDAIDPGPGTSFVIGGSPPVLPAGQDLAPIFDHSPELRVAADKPPPQNGINPGEWLAVILNLDGATYAEVLDALDDGSMRIGAHLIAFSDGSSESAVTPEPATLIVLVAGGLMWLLQYRRH